MSIAVTLTTEPTAPPFVVPLNVITSFDEPLGTNAFLAPSLTPIKIAPVNKSPAPVVLISRSVAAVSKKK